MFNQLFKRESAVARHAAAPMLSERLRYLEHLQIFGASHRTLIQCAHYLLCIGTSFRWRFSDSVTRQQIDTAADHWLSRHASDSRRTDGQATRTAFVSTTTNWLRFLKRLQPDFVEQPDAAQIQAYARYMREERNLSPVTIRCRCGRAAEFLRLLAAQGSKLGELDWVNIDQALALKGRRDGLTRASMQTYGYNVRSFLRFLHEHKQCRPGLAETVRPVRVYKDETLPAGAPWESVLELLESMQGEGPGMVRDRAIVLLFALYGLRAAEVRRLCLDDLDWDRALIRIRRSKQDQHVDCYPLTDSVADALAQYLHSVRPKNDRREVFLHLRAPYQPVSNSALWQVVSRRLRPMDLGLRHHGPHALRHACATRLLASGLSMKEIGDFLGHSHPATTAIYAKVDIGGLRRVADVNLGRFL